MNPLEVEAAIQKRHHILAQKMDRWAPRGLCVDLPEDEKKPFIADRPKNSVLAAQMEAPAKAICIQCPVRLLCLQHAINWPEIMGIWGGLNYEERKPLMDHPVSVDGKLG